MFAPSDPLAIGDVAATRFLPPLSEDVHGGFHLLGTDAFGRDLFTRMMLGGRLSLAVGLLGSVLAGLTGVAKAISKEELYGSLDPTTLEWTNGVFTHILRKIIDNVRGEAGRRHWIVFDGDVDPEWAENLNRYAVY